jgi:hypothetical protein
MQMNEDLERRCEAAFFEARERAKTTAAAFAIALKVRAIAIFMIL